MKGLPPLKSKSTVIDSSLTNRKKSLRKEIIPQKTVRDENTVIRKVPNELIDANNNLLMYLDTENMFPASHAYYSDTFGDLVLGGKIGNGSVSSSTYLGIDTKKYANIEAFINNGNLIICGNLIIDGNVDKKIVKITEFTDMLDTDTVIDISDIKHMLPQAPTNQRTRTVAKKFTGETVELVELTYGDARKLFREHPINKALIESGILDYEARNRMADNIKVYEGVIICPVAMKDKAISAIKEIMATNKHKMVWI